MSTVDTEKLPKHVAIIMDGNGRWARSKGLDRIRGHHEGANSVREVVRTTRELRIPWLTLYAFSEENWRRSAHEIRALMGLLKRFLKSERKEMQANGVRLEAIGRIAKLPEDTRRVLQETMDLTSGNKELILTLALSYGGRQEILDTLRGIGQRIQKGELQPDEVTEELVSRSLYTAHMPDPDLLIRTSGEYRVSNFLLWQIAYTEIYVTPTLWPDFRKEEYLTALEDFARRERRYGSAPEG